MMMMILPELRHEEALTCKDSRRNDCHWSVEAFTLPAWKLCPARANDGVALARPPKGPAGERQLGVRFSNTSGKVLRN